MNVVEAKNAATGEMMMQKYAVLLLRMCCIKNNLWL